MLTTYRPSHLLSAIQFASARTATYLGLFKDRQIAFEHKPWVESELEGAGVAMVPWRYVSDDNRLVAHQMLKDGPVVLRASRRSGGVGISLVRSDAELEEQWPEQSDHFVAVAPFLADAIPVNVGACVFPDGISVHPASVQIIGHPGCTDRVFGYCGNDFGSFAQFAESVVADIDANVRAVGDWLRSMGYLGAFGVDFLVDDDIVRFCEVNPRFQGSTAVSCELARSVGQADILLDHLAAFLCLPQARGRTLGEWAADLAPTAQVIAHNQHVEPVIRQAHSWTPTTSRLELLPPTDVAVDPGGVMFRAKTSEVVSRTGFDLSGWIEDELRSSAARFDIGGSSHQ